MPTARAGRADARNRVTVPGGLIGTDKGGRHMRPSTVIRGVLFALFLGAAASAQTSPLVGTWTTAWFPNTPAVIYVTLLIAPNGQLREHLMNRLGVAYDLFGTYQFDPVRGVFRFIFTDWAPKETCTPMGTCLRFTPPQGQLGVENTAQVSFPNPNLMIGRAADGTTMTWGRTD